MSSYEPPNYLNNNQFISTFNNVNFIEPNSSSNLKISTLDNRYLKRITNDSNGSNTLTIGNISIQSSLSVSGLSALNNGLSVSGLTTLASSLNVSGLTTLNDNCIVRKSPDTYDGSRLFKYPPYGVPANGNNFTALYNHTYCDGNVIFSSSADWSSGSAGAMLDQTLRENVAFTNNNLFSATAPFTYIGTTDYFNNGSYIGPWVKIQFPERFILKIACIYGAQGGGAWSTENPNGYRIYGSNNPASTNINDWVLLLPISDGTFNTIYQYNELGAGNISPFNTYLLIINSNYGNLGAGTNRRASIGELLLYGNPIIQQNLDPAQLSIINRQSQVADYKSWGVSSLYKSNLSDNVLLYTPSGGGNRTVYINPDDEIILINNTANANVWVVLQDSRVYGNIVKTYTIKDAFGNAGNFPIAFKSLNPTEKIDGVTIYPNSQQWTTDSNIANANFKITSNFGYIKLCVSSTFGYSILDTTIQQEGTFTASFVNATTNGSLTYTNNICYYKIIGKTLFFTVRFDFNRNGATYSANQVEVQLGNLPKPISSINTRYSHTMGYCIGFTPQTAGNNKYHSVIFGQSPNENIKVFRDIELSPISILYNEIPSSTTGDNGVINISGFYYIS